MPSVSASHRRVEPSTSVNKNVTTPEGAAAAGADTPAECHIRHAATLHMREPDPETPRSYWQTGGDPIKPLLGSAQHRRHRVGYRRWIGDRSQLEKPDTVGIFVD